MSATARNHPAADADMDETVVYEPNHLAQARAAAPGPDTGYAYGGRDAATGSSDMPTTTPPPGPQGQGRYTYSSGARPLDGYTVKRAIGRGGFGEVYYATSDSGKEVALKLVLRNLDVERRGVVQCMNLKCPNLVTVYDLKTNDAGDAFVIMEYVAGQSLAQVLAKQPDGMPAAEARAWLKGLVEGVSYLHDHGIVHRDLKPANLFMEEGTVKIGDYGLAKLITPSQGTEHSESIGTCHYMAPEIASGKYSKAIDVYAIGVILFEMLTGRVPFDGESVAEVLMKHLTSRPDVSALAEPYRSIVAKALEKNPAHRQQHVYDLLPPDDAPKAPNVRFIGDGRTAAPLREPTAAASNEEILRIGAEEPVFYIGPDTRPPRSIPQRVRANLVGWRRPQPQPQPQPQRRPPPQPQPQPQVRRPQPQPQPKVKPRPVVETPPPPPPPLPVARVRMAELTRSMFWAAPVAALFTAIALVPMEVDPFAHPEQAAFLFGLTLLGSWGAIVPAKLAEGRAVPKTFRRALNLASGAAVGLAGWGLASWLDLGPIPGMETLVDKRILDGSDPLAYAGYFGLASLLGGVTGFAARDRTRRVRVFTTLKTTAAAALVGLVMPVPQPWGLAAAGMSALVAQSVAPWSKPAAAYARYAAKQAKRDARKVA